ncbi:hypothetical protein SUDANB105_04442 [Streptomyces sp. enrichment culture]
MAELQDDLHTAPEAGELGDLPLDTPFPPEPYAPLPEPDPDAAPLERAYALLETHPVADGYSGLPWALRHLPWYDLELGESAVDTDVPRLRKGRVGALFCSLHLPEGLAANRAVAATLEQLDLVRTVVAGYPEHLRPARTAGEVVDAHHCGRAAVLLGPATAAALDDSLGLLRVLHGLGLRVLTLTGTSWASEAGLTRFGDAVVREMNRLGVLADLSGASEATVRRVLATSRAPVLATRSAARACAPTPPTCPTTCSSSWAPRRGCAWCR